MALLAPGAFVSPVCARADVKQTKRQMADSDEATLKVRANQFIFFFTVTEETAQFASIKGSVGQDNRVDVDGRMLGKIIPCTIRSVL